MAPCGFCWAEPGTTCTDDGQHYARHRVGQDEHFCRRTSHNRRDRDAPFTTGFMRYWHDTGHASPEERATERLALAQIWARLRPAQRDLLAAMAEHEDYAKAAAALGKTWHTFATQISHARTAFRELWHEGETPSRPWGAPASAPPPACGGSPVAGIRRLTGRGWSGQAARRWRRCTDPLSQNASRAERAT
jgi:hypothetical protein